MASKTNPSVQQEPIAVIGIGCRLPGKSSSPSELWDLLVKNRSGHCPVPKSRYNSDAFYHPNAARPGSIDSTGGYFIQEDIRAFDNAFFGINNLEAMYMDAQQRKLLEVVYESFESAGVPLERVQKSQTGVYIGNFTNDFMVMQYRDPEYFTRFSATGSGLTVMANRISHCFDLRGPSMVLDTACSSSLYALHCACLGLDAHDCDAAVVASANLIQTPEGQLVATKAGILSPDSFCHTFDETANGYGRAEGVSAVYLKRLSDAIRDGDPIRTVIRSTAINGNGKTPGIVQPSADGQEAVIRAAYDRAGLSTDGTDYVEAHGTGTRVGDPIEIEAISRVFRHQTGRPTLVGGVKPNLGHSEGASGLVSLIKVALALEKGIIPATLGVRNINPSIKTADWNVKIVTENIEWPVSSIPRASINSFGFGGANSHAILEAAPRQCRGYTNPGSNGNSRGICHTKGYMNEQAHTTGRSPSNDDGKRLYMIPLSARSSASLTQQVTNLATCIAQPKHRIAIQDLSYTLSSHRSKLSTRGFVLASQSTLTSNMDPEKFAIHKIDSSGNLPLTFIYTGQGAQWTKMGVELLQYSSIFLHSIRGLDFCLQTLSSRCSPDWTIEGVLRDSSGKNDINLADKSQTVCTAVQIAITDVLHDLGIHPKTVIGHSSGEIAAAYAAGIITPRQAITAAYFRGTVVSCSLEKGGMACVGLGKLPAQRLIDELSCHESIVIACINSPENTTLSGDETAVDVLLQALKRRGIWARRLDTGGTAYHSHHMKKIGEVYQAWLKEEWSNTEAVTNGRMARHMDDYVNGHAKGYKEGVRMISTISGNNERPEKVASPAYWRSSLESPVLFENAVRQIMKTGRSHFVEIGPHSTLKLPITQTSAVVDGDGLLYNSALIRSRNAWMTILDLVGSLYLRGRDEIRLEKISFHDDIPSPKILVDLPPYPWDYSSPALWIESRAVTEFRNRKYPRHDLLGSQVTGGNPSVVVWRNILNVNEVTWLQDHRLGPSVVFPAAGYIAMTVEAICQAAGLHLHDCPGVELRNTSFVSTLDLDPKKKPSIEIFAELRSSGLSSICNSEAWSKFSVSSISNESSRPTLHMRTLVKLSEVSLSLARQIQLNKSQMTRDAPRIWYDKFSKESLNWGPQFAAMEEVYCDRKRQAHQAAATTYLLRGDRTGHGQNFQYIAHPISIDSMLQAAFVATTAGHVSDLRATVPVAIDSLQISAPSLLDMDLNKSWSIDTISEKVGLGTVSIFAELYNSFDQVLVHMGRVRCIPYQGKVQTDASVHRSPIVRAMWKPDINTTSGSELSKYLDWFIQDSISKGLELDEDLLRLAGALDLAVHKKPGRDILQLGEHHSIEAFVLKLLRSDSPLRRFNTYTRALLSDNKEIRGTEISLTNIPNEKSSEPAALDPSKKFDIIFLTSSQCKLTLSYLDSLLAPGAVIISTEIADVSGTRKPPAVTIDIIQRPLPTTDKMEDAPVIMVNRDGDMSEFELDIKQELESYFRMSIPMVGLSQVRNTTVPDRCIVVSTLEARKPLLTAIDGDEMKQLQDITGRMAVILWICGGDFLDMDCPEFAPVLGMSRALMAEQPSLRFAVLGVDDLYASKATSGNVKKIMRQLLCGPFPDLEFTQKNGVIHVLRWEPEERLNTTFRLKQGLETTHVPLECTGRLKLNIRNPGQLDTIHFVHEEYPIPLPSDHIQIQVKSVGINAKDLYVLLAKIDTEHASCSCECAGVVTAVGDGVSGLRPGDRVVAMGPGHFATVERLPQWAVQKLLDNEEFTTASTIPIVFSTVIYGLKHRANLKAGETILIHSAAGGVGMAAIQYAKYLGAKIFATVGNKSKKKFLAERFGLDPAHIFSSRDSSFLPAIRSATNGQGVDVVLNSLTDELLQSSFEACAEFGRFIEIGKRDILDHRALDMGTFARNVTFSAFDLSSLFHSKKDEHHQLWQKLLAESLDFIRTGIFQPCSPIEVFDVSDITSAFRYFSLGTRIGKVAVSFEDDQSNIRVIPKKYDTVLNPNKSYMMIGCLGGLGRSLSKWMMARGARNFVFLSRSALDRPQAKDLVDDLQDNGANVKVVRGDVSKYGDVECAVRAAQGPIGGVIQAAMALKESLWSQMPHWGWHTTIGPKIQGTWNIHNALLADGRDAQVDFFVMTSSIAGTVGTATESNYCAANAFLDAFARYRNKLGLPAISVGYGMISEVGYLHEHPEIEAFMKRRGIHSINEDELLQIMDLAITNQLPETWTPYYDRLVGSHILTGVEFEDIKQLRDQGFEGDNTLITDPRAALFGAALKRSINHQSFSSAGGSNLSEQVLKALRDTSRNNTAVLNALGDIISQKVSSLILLPEGKLKSDQQLGDFGLDSMLAAEFRTFIFHALGVDVPFVMFLSHTTTVDSLVTFIAEGLRAKS